ncbi:hypothetical protein [Stutzerimonas sp. FeSN7]|uniref:hypothetical protein n=1 Tax=Stutzerimonas sp. FeSN7 TaxID=3035479 RepID=UPI002553E37C|nr:hypothetical protein [Stutzerimonas sp. FeSN7]MDL2174682.1 hypothetical protein [Stutzerimonas sp. FeSN7]
MADHTSTQCDLFSPANMASVACFPPAPALVAHRWPYPGLSGEDSARSSLAQSAQFVEVIALTIKRQRAALITDAEVKALLPADWKHILGRWVHATLAGWQGEQHGIQVEHVSHGDGGYHWQYRMADSQSG